MGKDLTAQERTEQIKTGRDNKAHEHFKQYAPVWITNEEIRQDEDAVVFDVIFLHPTYGWVTRRYHYDAFTDVLYQKGQRQLEEEETFEIQTTDPYIESRGLNTVLSYGG